MEHLALADLEAGLDHVRRSPADGGRVEMVVRRPAVDEREIVDQAHLSLDDGLVGDTWSVRGSSSTPDGRASPEAQVTLINARFARLVAGSDERAPLAGDQLHVDLDLSVTNAPPGTRLEIGEAVVEITAKPHTGCHKFAARFGRDALRLLNTPEGRELRLRGVNARVVVPGLVRRGDPVRRRPPGA